jgi:hypothetical protein
VSQVRTTFKSLNPRWLSSTVSFAAFPTGQLGWLAALQSHRTKFTSTCTVYRGIQRAGVQLKTISSSGKNWKTRKTCMLFLERICGCCAKKPNSLSTPNYSFTVSGIWGLWMSGKSKTKWGLLLYQRLWKTEQLFICSTSIICIGSIMIEIAISRP